MPIRRTRTTHIVATLLAAALSPVALATPISTVELPDNFGGPVSCLGAGNDAASLSLNAADCDAAGGFAMTPFGDDPNAPGTTVTVDRSAKWDMRSRSRPRCSSPS